MFDNVILFEQIVGISLTNFDMLFYILELNLKLKSLLSREALLLSLIHKQQYPSLKMLSWIFNIDQSTITRIVKQMNAILFNKLQVFIHLPTKVQRITNGYQFFEGDKIIQVTMVIH